MPASAAATFRARRRLMTAYCYTICSVACAAAVRMVSSVSSRMYLVTTYNSRKVHKSRRRLRLHQSSAYIRYCRLQSGAPLAQESPPAAPRLTQHTTHSAQTARRVRVVCFDARSPHPPPAQTIRRASRTQRTRITHYAHGFALAIIIIVARRRVVNTSFIAPPRIRHSLT